MALYTESIADQTDHFPNVLFSETLHTVMTTYDFLKFTADAILFREIQWMKRGIIMF